MDDGCILKIISLRLNLVKDVGLNPPFSPPFNPPFNSDCYYQDKLFEMDEDWIRYLISLRLKEMRADAHQCLISLRLSIVGTDKMADLKYVIKINKN